MAGWLAEMGFYVGRELLTPSDDNPKGFYERMDVVGYNDKILEALGCSWHNLEKLPRLKLPLNPLGDLVLRDMVYDLNENRPWVLKDPRLSITWPYWAPYLNPTGKEALVVVMLRDLDEIALSLEKRQGMPIEEGRQLARQYVNFACRATVETPNLLFVDYDKLFKPQYRRGLRIRLSKIFEQPFPARPGFIDKRLRHHDLHKKGGGKHAKTT